MTNVCCACCSSVKKKKKTKSLVSHALTSSVLQMKQIATGGRDGKIANTTEKVLELPPPMNIQAINKTPNSPHLVFFNVDSLIGLYHNFAAF